MVGVRIIFALSVCFVTYVLLHATAIPAHASSTGRCGVPWHSVATGASVIDSTDTLRVLFFGDSITEGWMDGVLRPADAFPRRVDSLLREASPPVNVLVRGRGGETTADALQRLSSDVLAARPDIVIVAFGSNDAFIHGYATAPRVSIDLFSRHLNQIGTVLRDAGTRVVLLGLPPENEQRFYTLFPAALYAPYGGMSALRRRYDEAVRRTAAQLGISYVSILFEPMISDSIALGFDGVHPTPEGHAALAVALTPVILREIAAVRARRTPDTFRAEVFPNPVRRDERHALYIRIDAPVEELLHITVCASHGGCRRGRDETLRPGVHFLPLDAADPSGTTLSAGAYIVYLTSSRRSLALPLIIR